MNLFLAIEISDQVKRNIDEQIEPLKKIYPDVQWTAPHLYHITLFHFADRYSEEKIVRQVENVTYDTPSFHLYTRENGIFMKNNLTLWAGFLKSQPIEVMVKRIKKELKINDDLKFFPHLTLAKYRIPSKQQYLLLKKRFLKSTIDVEFGVTQITLFESVIEKNVPVYIPKKTFPLLQDT